MELQEQELYQIVFNRNLSEDLIKESQITAAKTKWIDAYLPAEFLEDIATNEEFVLNYIKPVWAWGAVYSNFNYISTSITDKGIIQMLVEGTAAVLGTDKLLNAKNEILQTVITLLKRLDTYATEQEELGTAGFENYTGLIIEPMLIKFVGAERYNQTPY